jgi:hypothetical protein
VTLTSLVVCLTLFAYTCGFIVGVLATQSWHEHRADEFAGQAIRDDEEVG